MTLSKRTLLFLSLALIGLHWTYQLLDHPLTPVIPTSFAELVRKIIVNKVILFAVLSLLLYLEPQGWAGVGVTRRDWGKHAGIGISIGLAMFLLLNVVLTAALEAVIPRPVLQGPSILTFFAQWSHLFIWLPIGIFGGGVVEELERIFILTRFEQWLGRRGLILGVVLSSVMFGVGHLYQGLAAALSIAVSGVVLALVFLRRRSALEAMTAHAFGDVLAMVAAAIMAHSAPHQAAVVGLPSITPASLPAVSAPVVVRWPGVEPQGRRQITSRWHYRVPDQQPGNQVIHPGDAVPRIERGGQYRRGWLIG